MDIAIKILLFFLGLVLGNWLAIGRDKRKEFNETVDIVYQALVKELDSVESSDVVVSCPQFSDLENLRRRMPRFKRRRFTKAVANYKESKSMSNWKQDGYGQAFYKDPQKVISSIQELLKFTERR